VALAGGLAATAWADDCPNYTEPAGTPCGTTSVNCIDINQCTQTVSCLPRNDRCEYLDGSGNCKSAANADVHVCCAFWNCNVVGRRCVSGQPGYSYDTYTATYQSDCPTPTPTTAASARR
jgi:hypothetical protein